MSPGGRLAALILAATLALGGGLLQQSRAGLLILAGLIVLGTVFDARYRGRKSALRGHWQMTAEREIDHETGTILAVWFDPISGERRYLPADQRPD